MTGGCADRVGLYVDNPKVYQMLTMRSGNDSARAMVIKLDNGKYFMDRIYSTCDFLVDKMINFAKSKKWFYRTTQHAGSCIISDYKDVNVSDYSNFTVSGLVYTDGEIPYQDTIRNYRVQDGLLDICHANFYNDYDGVLDSTEGTLEDDDTQSCDGCGDRYNYEDLCSNESGDVYCMDCWDEISFYCPKCNETACQNDSVYIKDIEQDWCSDCARHYAYICNKCGEAEAVLTATEVDGEYYCNSCFENLSKCDKCNEVVSEVNDNEFCTKCQTDEDTEKQNRKNAEVLAYFGREDIFQIQAICFGPF